jgi:hypothetical protein
LLFFFVSCPLRPGVVAERRRRLDADARSPLGAQARGSSPVCRCKLAARVATTRPLPAADAQLVASERSCRQRGPPPAAPLPRQSEEKGRGRERESARSTLTCGSHYAESAC